MSPWPTISLGMRWTYLPPTAYFRMTSWGAAVWLYPELMENGFVPGMLHTAHHIWVALLEYGGRTRTWKEGCASPQPEDLCLTQPLFYKSVHAPYVLAWMHLSQACQTSFFNAKHCLQDLLSPSKSQIWYKLSLMVVKVAGLWGAHSLCGGAVEDTWRRRHALPWKFNVLCPCVSLSDNLRHGERTFKTHTHSTESMWFPFYWVYMYF